MIARFWNAHQLISSGFSSPEDCGQLSRFRRICAGFTENKIIDHQAYCHMCLSAEMPLLSYASGPTPSPILSCTLSRRRQPRHLSGKGTEGPCHVSFTFGLVAGSAMLPRRPTNCTTAKNLSAAGANKMICQRMCNAASPKG